MFNPPKWLFIEGQHISYLIHSMSLHSLHLPTDLVLSFSDYHNKTECGKQYKVRSLLPRVCRLTDTPTGKYMGTISQLRISFFGFTYLTTNISHHKQEKGP